MKYLRLVAYTILTASFLGLSACSEDDPGGGGTDGSDFNRQTMLANLGEGVILPAYTTLNITSGDLLTAVNGFANAPTEQSLADARAALKSAWLAWQGVNLYQFGPASDESLRSRLNTFPTDDRTINGNIEAGDYNLASISNLSAVGFPALDYLLHGQGDVEATLAAYTQDENAANRGQYLIDLATDIRGRVRAVVEGWSAEGDNYLETFVQNDGNAVGSSLSELINALNLQYERFTRDSKIGIPAGVRSLGIPIPESTEAFYGGYSLELAVANMQAYKSLFNGTQAATGTNGQGLDDYLVALNATNVDGPLADQINAQLDLAISMLSDLDDPLSNTIQTNNEAVLSTYVELQALVVLLKAEMPSAMGVTINFQDNDGD